MLISLTSVIPHVKCEGDDSTEDLGRDAPERRRQAAARAPASVGRSGCGRFGRRGGDARAPLESFRLSQILSFGGLVVAENSDTEDVALFEDIIRVEKKFYGDWSKETRQLLADGDALAAYKRRAFDLYRQRFAPEALLRRVDAWNERGAPDGWQDS